MSARSTNSSAMAGVLRRSMERISEVFMRLVTLLFTMQDRMASMYWDLVTFADGIARGVVRSSR